MTTYTISRIWKTTPIAFFFVIILSTYMALLHAQPASAQETSDEMFTLDLENVDIYTLIETVSRRTGRNFIVDPSVQATVNVVSSEPINADKLYEMFLSVLAIHGYAAVPAGSLVKIVPDSTGVQSDLPLMNEPTDSNDELVTHVMRLENLSAPEMVAALTPLLPESASVSAEPTGNTMIVTARADNIAKLIELILKLEHP